MKILEAMHEVQKVEIEKRYEGRKVVDAIFKIYPTKNFICMMIENNKATKRTNEVIIDADGKPLIEPMPSDCASRSEYHHSKMEYELNKGKHVSAINTHASTNSRAESRSTMDQKKDLSIDHTQKHITVNEMHKKGLLSALLAAWPLAGILSIFRSFW